MILKKITGLLLIFTTLLSAQNTNIALGKPSSSDSFSASTNTSSKAVDGNIVDVESRWLSANTSWPHWIEIDLLNNYEIEQIKFWTGSGGYNRPVQYEFQVWNGSSWITMVDGSSNNLAIVDETFSKISTSKVRLFGLGGIDNYFRLYELEVYGILESSGSGNENSVWVASGNNINYTNGSVGIGTNVPDAKLTVKGNIHTNEVKVDLQGAVAPDYVFYDNYKLKKLEEVQRYIEKYGHLPNIPSAKEMKQQGINLKEMNLKLLEKIEELTLYILMQNKNQKLQNLKQLELEKRLKKLERKRL